jgi:hypothetical protein
MTYAYQVWPDLIDNCLLIQLLGKFGEGIEKRNARPPVRTCKKLYKRGNDDLAILVQCNTLSELEDEWDDGCC